MRIRPPLLTILVTVALAAPGCGGTPAPAPPPASRLVPVAGTPGKIVLSATGAQRIGLQTVPARARPARAGVIVPASAIVYDSRGRTLVYVATAPLTFVSAPVTVVSMDGTQAVLSRGPHSGMPVVSVGAEELYGVQTGVLAQT